MTDRTKAVEDAVTDEWRTSREIAEAGGMGDPDGMRLVRAMLRRMVRQGRAERSERTVSTPKGERTSAAWRRRA